MLLTGNTKEKSEFNSYISDDNKQDARDSHAHIVHILKKIKPEILVNGSSTVELDTNGCAKQYRCDFDI